MSESRDRRRRAEVSVQEVVKTGLPFKATPAQIYWSESLMHWVRTGEHLPEPPELDWTADAKP